MDNNKPTFGKLNFILIAASVVIILIGFLLMTGPNCTNDVFEPDIFSVRRTKVAPVVCIIGFFLMIAAILVKPREKNENRNQQ